MKLALERLDEIFGVIPVHLDVLVPRDPELVVLEHLHAGKKFLDVVGDEVFDGDEAQATRFVVRELDKAGKNGRDLEPREIDRCGLGVPDPNREV